MKSAFPLLGNGLMGLLVLLLPGTLHAEPSGVERATAEALFQQGTALMSERKYQAACEKFEGSEQLDPALGTMLRLADCYGRAGRTASAWAMFLDVASTARTRNETDRVQIATERASDLEKRLSMLEIDVADTSTLALTIRANGLSVPRGSWNAPLPLDPGPVRIEVKAPHHRTWITTVELGQGPTLKKVAVPVLEPEPGSARDGSLPPGKGSAAATTSSSRGGTLRTVGYVLGGAGLLGLGAGGFLTVRTETTNDESRTHCRTNDASACSQAGLNLRNDARTLGNAATVAWLGGSALLASGVVLLLTAPKDAPETTSTAGVGLRLMPTGFDVEGRF